VFPSCGLGPSAPLLRSAVTQLSPQLSVTSKLRQAEIEYLRLTSLSDEQVRGLQVAMDNAPRMRRVQSVGDLDGPVKYRIQCEWLVSYLVLQRLAFHQLHGDVRRTVEFSDLVNRAKCWDD
jgi:hypothetical protein